MKIPMNLITLTLIATSITVSATFSPTPHSTADQPADIVAGDTSDVSVSSEEDDELSIAAAAIVGVADDVAGKAKDVLSYAKRRFSATPRELRCDPVGKCKHRIAGVLSKAKDKAEEKVKELAVGVTSKSEECTEAVRQNAQDNTKGVEVKKKLSHFAKRGTWSILRSIWHIYRPKSMDSLMGVIHIIGFAAAYGTSIWVTFEMSHVLPVMLPRQQFGMLQSKMYPLYFKAMVGSIGLALVGHLTRQRVNLFKNKTEMIQALNLMVAMLSVLVNLRFWEPRTTKVMFEMMKMETEEGRGIDNLNATATTVGSTPTETVVPESRSAKDETVSKVGLRQVNWLSSLLNIGTLMGLTWHLMYLGETLALNT